MKDMMYLDDLTRSTRRREFADGLFDLVLAVTFLMLGVGGWLFFSPWAMQWYIKSLVLNREATIIALLTLPVLLILIIFGLRRFVDYIRRTYLWRNSGYVKSLPWQVNRPISMIAVAVTIIMIVVAAWLFMRGLISQDVVLSVLVSSVGVATGVVFLGMGRDLQLRRYIWVGIFGMLMSISLLLLPLTFSTSWLVLGLLWLVLLSFSGLWAMRETLLHAQEQGDE